MPIITDPYHWLPIENAGGQQGYADRDGSILIAPRYYDLGRFCFGLAAAIIVPHRDDSLGYLGIDGQWQISPRFYGADDFAACGLAAVSVADEGCLSGYGYCNRNGELAIAAQFDKAYEFDEHDMAKVADQGLLGMIDTSGAWLIPPRYDQLHPFAANGLARARDEDERVLFINRNGDTVLTPDFDSVFQFGPEGLAMVVQDGRYGLIDSQGELAVTPQYDDMADLKQGLARVEIDGRYGFINRAGELVIAARFADASSFMPCGLAVVVCDATGRQGCIDRSGELVIPCTFDDIDLDLYPDVLDVRRDGRDGYIDLAGNWLFDRQIDA